MLWAMLRIHTETSNDFPEGGTARRINGQHLPKGLVMIDNEQIEYPQ